MSRRSRRKKEKMLAMQLSGAEEEAEHGALHEEKPHEQKSEGKKSNFVQLYDKHYKWLVIVPILFLLLAIGQIIFQTASTGDFIQKGITLKGGVTVTVPYSSQIDTENLERLILAEIPGLEVTVRTLESTGQVVGYVVEADAQSESETNGIIKILEQETGVDTGLYGVETIQPSLGESFFREILVAMLVAFLFMAVVVFITFRTFVPSFAAVFSVLTDITVTLAIVNIMGMKISSAGIAAFLMLIGYSIDTDILLSTRVLRRTEGTVVDRVISSMRTGMLMTITTIIAASIALVFTQSETLKQIMAIILIGLVVDIFTTWFLNAGMLKWYAEHRKTGKKNGQA